MNVYKAFLKRELNVYDKLPKISKTNSNVNSLSK